MTPTHDPGTSCWCGPSLQLALNDDGTTSWRMLHHDADDELVD